MPVIPRISNDLMVSQLSGLGIPAESPRWNLRFPSLQPIQRVVKTSTGFGDKPIEWLASRWQIQTC
jgi:hypothetical protein